MAGAIGPGDWVECIGFPGRSGPARGDVPVVGGLYCVRAMREGSDRIHGGVSLGLLLVGLYAYHPDGQEGAWHPDCFRPVYRPNADIIASLKAPSPYRELADA